jgi:hypothetical protein
MQGVAATRLHKLELSPEEIKSLTMRSPSISIAPVMAITCTIAAARWRPAWIKPEDNLRATGSQYE